MALAGADNQRNLAAIALLALFLSFSTFSFINLVTRPVACFPGDIGTAKCPLTSAQALGTWFNMPSAATELMGNASYRGLLITRSSAGESGLAVGLSLSCILPSNTLGAILQLQYANYSDTTHLNTTNFVNIGSAINIDNSANNPCPGNLETLTGILPSISVNPTVFIFRVIGSGGGGTGDNPRFSNIQVYITQILTKTFTLIVTGITTAHFLMQAYSSYPVSTATTVNFEWFATNSSNTAGCGFSTDPCLQHGTSSCIIPLTGTNCPTTTVTFTTVFGGSVDVVATPKNTGSTFVIPIGTIGLLNAQTLTV